MELPGKRLYYRAFDLYVGHNISLADAHNAAYIGARGTTEIYSFDPDFDRIASLTRIEPDAET